MAIDPGHAAGETMRAQVSLLPDRRRLHLQDGPIDLIVGAFGHRDEIVAAYDAAISRFTTILDELCSELSLLRTSVGPHAPMPTKMTAKRMALAVAPYAERTFITPMAAVAGAVAEETLDAMTSVAQLSKAYVNDGGDIALHLAPGEQFIIGMIDRPDRPSLFGTTTLFSVSPVRGLATSGWRGRSFSLGIADAVTVLARSAAQADAAATFIANAVDLPRNPKIHRVPARTLDPDTDLADALVTRCVANLSPDEIRCALEAGVAVAEQLRSEGLIHSAALHLQGETQIVAKRRIASIVARTEHHRSLAHA
jgi:uncharacterized protein